MAITIMAQGSALDASYVIDWDSTANTIGLTANAPTTSREMTLNLETRYGHVVVDCITGIATLDGSPAPTVAGDLRNKGRAVIIGPGSVVGVTTRVNSINRATDIQGVGLSYSP